MPNPPFQFSVRAILVVMAIVAALAAFIANYPLLAACIGFGALGALVIGGMEGGLKVLLNDRRPYVASTGWIGIGIAFIVGAFEFFKLVQRQGLESSGEVYAIVISAAFGLVCIWCGVQVFRNRNRNQVNSDEAHRPEGNPDDSVG